MAALAETARQDELWLGTKVFDPRHWHSYVRGALAYFLSNRCAVRAEFEQWFVREGRSCRVHVGSIGARQLSAAGGVSSSAALTGAVSSAVRALTRIAVPLDDLTSVDLGEFLLGKMAGKSNLFTHLNSNRFAQGALTKRRKCSLVAAKRRWSDRIPIDL